MILSRSWNNRFKIQNRVDGVTKSHPYGFLMERLIHIEQNASVSHSKPQNHFRWNFSKRGSRGAYLGRANAPGGSSGPRTLRTMCSMKIDFQIWEKCRPDVKLAKTLQITLKRDIIVVRTCCDWYDNRITSSTPFLLRVSAEGRVFFACRILDYCFFVWTMVDLFMRENMYFFRLDG